MESELFYKNQLILFYSFWFYLCLAGQALVRPFDPLYKHFDAYVPIIFIPTCSWRPGRCTTLHARRSTVHTRHSTCED